MTIFELIIYLVIAAVCGAIARGLAGGTSGGCLVSLLVGFLGAFLGTWIARTFRLPLLLAVSIKGHPFPVVWSIIGGVILVAIAHAALYPTYRRHYFYR